MARRPDLDERLVMKERSGERSERIHVVDLAKYLHHRSDYIKKFAKKHGYLRRARGLGTSWRWYVTPHGARHVIMYIRAIQGEFYVNGKDFHALKEKVAATRLRYPRKPRH